MGLVFCILGPFGSCFCWTNLVGWVPWKGGSTRNMIWRFGDYVIVEVFLWWGNLISLSIPLFHCSIHCLNLNIILNWDTTPILTVPPWSLAFCNERSYRIDSPTSATIPTLLLLLLLPPPRQMFSQWWRTGWPPCLTSLCQVLPSGRSSSSYYFRLGLNNVKLLSISTTNFATPTVGCFTTNTLTKI